MDVAALTKRYGEQFAPWWLSRWPPQRGFVFSKETTNDQL
jgi:hypothetical protein